MSVGDYGRTLTAIIECFPLCQRQTRRSKVLGKPCSAWGARQYRNCRECGLNNIDYECPHCCAVKSFRLVQKAKLIDIWGYV